jgi:hypothetical protein
VERPEHWRWSSARNDRGKPTTEANPRSLQHDPRSLPLPSGFSLVSLISLVPLVSLVPLGLPGSPWFPGYEAPAS